MLLWYGNAVNVCHAVIWSCDQLCSLFRMCYSRGGTVGSQTWISSLTSSFRWWCGNITCHTMDICKCDIGSRVVHVLVNSQLPSWVVVSRLHGSMSHVSCLISSGMDTNTFTCPRMVGNFCGHPKRIWCWKWRLQSLSRRVLSCPVVSCRVVSCPMVSCSVSCPMSSMVRVCDVILGILKQMSSEWPFFDSTLNLIEMVFAKVSVCVLMCFTREWIRDGWMDGWLYVCSCMYVICMCMFCLFRLILV